jgi:hypothetical protein
VSVPARGWLRLADGPEEDQVPRLLDFRAAHPEVSIELDGFWRAVIPAPGGDGETVVCRYELRDVLDKLAELLGGQPDGTAG